MTFKAIDPRGKVLIFHKLGRRTNMIHVRGGNRSTIGERWFNIAKMPLPLLALGKGTCSLLASPLLELASVTLLVGSTTFNGAVDNLRPSRNLVNMLSTSVVMEVFNVSKAALNSSRETEEPPSSVDKVGLAPECSPTSSTVSTILFGQ